MSLVSGRVSVERWLSRLSGSLRQNGVILFGTGKGLDFILNTGCCVQLNRCGQTFVARVRWHFGILDGSADGIQDAFFVRLSGILSCQVQAGSSQSWSVESTGAFQ